MPQATNLPLVITVWRRKPFAFSCSCRCCRAWRAVCCSRRCRGPAAGRGPPSWGTRDQRGSSRWTGRPLPAHRGCCRGPDLQGRFGLWSQEDIGSAIVNTWHVVHRRKKVIDSRVSCKRPCRTNLGVIWQS